MKRLSYNKIDSEVFNYDLLNISDPDFFEITKFSAELCEVEYSLTTLVYKKQLKFKSSFGLEDTECSINDSICKYALLSGESIFIVEDALEETRYSKIRDISKKTNVRFYAGVPLFTNSGIAVGTLCVFDNSPKKLDPFQISSLKLMGKQISRVFELKTKNSQLLSYQNKLIKSNEHFQTILKSSGQELWDYDLRKNTLFISEGFKRRISASGKDNNEVFLEILNRISEKEYEKIYALFGEALKDPRRRKVKFFTQIKKDNHEHFNLKCLAILKRDKFNKPQQILGTVEFLGKDYILGVLESIEKKVIKSSVQGNLSLEKIFGNFIQQVEAIFPSLIFSIMKVKNNRLYNFVSPSLPKSLVDLFNGILIGPDAGSCGTAAYLKKKIVSSSILSDSKWSKYHAQIKIEEIRSCISIPILNNKGEPISTVAIYLKEERHPNKLEHYLIERISRLITILLLKFEYLKSLEIANERYEFVNKATNDAIYDWDLTNSKIHFGSSFFRLIGFKENQSKFSRADFVSLIHNKDLHSYKKSLFSFFSQRNKNQWRFSFRIKKENGEYAFVDEVVYALRDPNGNPTRLIGVLRDLTSEKIIDLQKKVQLQISTIFRNRKKNLKEILNEVTQYLIELSDFEFAEIWLTDLEKQKINLVSNSTNSIAAGKFYSYPEKIEELFIGQGLPGQVWQNKSFLHLDEKDLSKKFLRINAAKFAGIKSTYAIPILNKKDFVGVILVGSNLSKIDFYGDNLFLSELGNYLGAEIVRKSQEEELNAFFYQAPDLMAVLSSDFSLVKINPSFCKLLNFKEYELVNKSILDQIDEKDHSRIKEFKPDDKAVIIRFGCRDGQQKLISCTLSGQFGRGTYSFLYGRDVTEFKKMEKLLERASEISKMGGWKFTFSNRKIYLSNQSKEILLLRGPNIFSSKKLKSVLGEKVFQSIKQKIFEASKANLAFDFEELILDGQRNEKWVRIIGAIEHEGEKCSAITGSIQDIDEKKKTEIRLRDVSNNVPGVIFQFYLNVDGSYFIKHVSSGSKEIWGLSPKESENNLYIVWKGIISGGDSKKLKKDILDSAKNLQRFKSSWRFLNKEGRIVHHEGFGNPVKKQDGSIVWDTLIVDATEQFQLTEMARNIAKIAKIGSWEAIIEGGQITGYKFSTILLSNLQYEGKSPSYFTDFLEFTDKKNEFEFRKILKTSFLKSGSHKRDFSVITRNKVLKWIHFVVKSEIIENQPVRIFGYIQDITSQKLGEIQIQKALNEKNKILESIGDGFFALDWNGHVSYWNKSAEDLIKISRENCLGKSIWPLFSVDTRKKFARFFRLIQKRKTNHIHKQEYFSDFEKWFDINIYVSEVGFSVFFTDVTKRKLAEEEIIQSNERFIIISNATTDIIWDYDIIKDKFFISDSFYRLVGLNKKSNIISLEDASKYVCDEDRRNIFNELCKSFQNKDENFFKNEFKIKAKNNDYAFVINRGTIIRNKAGKAIRALGSMTDISFQKEYEASLRRLNDTLRQKALELEKSNKELEQFAYVASHDLQEPLRMVKSFMGLLKKKYENSLDAKAKQYIDFAVEGSNQMRAIILNLLEFSKIQQEEITLELFDIRDIFDSLMINLNRDIKDKKAEILISSSIPIYSNKSMLFQVFQNLISNALKYSDPSRKPVVDISITQKDQAYIFKVSDNGLGMKEEYLDKIFALFSRLHTKNEIPGTGLGLAIVKKIIEKLGGKIWVESSIGVGSTFFFEIPARAHESSND
ncbi:PAS domain S-box protein [Algoriphagus sp. NBT04N3]|jgi:PAS domain S-box-containing protein|uniref:PAS domain S-box protein n=1 Tax=Algoriphagus sp. NBT04N3 TaxID=2705473 RepID=UPI001C63B63D|nr:PAS domain S-box protein [Algoriphagus sp. NBT04N3]QYH38930.1 PAS domain S-box protein [Algoriphagus sp. NBT04N3]